MEEPTPLRAGLDRAGLALSGLCVAHCLFGIALVALLGFGGSIFFEPSVHRVGLALAAAIAAFSIGAGALRHRRLGASTIATAGLAFMAGGLLVPHGTMEVVLTVVGVSLVALGHVLNLRHARDSAVPDYG